MSGFMQEEPIQLMFDSRRQVVGGGVSQEVTDSKMSQFDDRDRIGNLPQDLIHCILKRLSVLDAARTSVLSKEWRYIWAMNTQLILDKLFLSQLPSSVDKDAHQSAFSRAIEMIISVHIGPVLSFNLYIPPKLDQCPVTRWIEQFCKRGIRFLDLDNSENNAYEIPSCFFDCVGLIHLALNTWILNAPYRCTSFTNLLQVQLRNISFNADISFGTQLEYLSVLCCTGIKHLGCQFTNDNSLTKVILDVNEQIDWRWFECTPQLRCLGLVFTSNATFDIPINLIKLLSNLPSIENFLTTGFTLQVWRPDLNILNGLATKVKNLKDLWLKRLGSYDARQIIKALYLIRCLPNLQGLGIELVDDNKSSIHPLALTINLDSIDWKDMSLGQLYTVVIHGVVGSNYVFHLLKLLLASSPSLKKMLVICSSEVTDPGEKLKIEQKVQHFPRRSSAAQIFFD